MASLKLMSLIKNKQMSKLHIYIKNRFLFCYIKFYAIIPFCINFSLILVCSYILNKNMVYADFVPIISDAKDISSEEAFPREWAFWDNNLESPLNSQSLPLSEADKLYCERVLTYAERAQLRDNRTEPLLYVQKDGLVSYTPDSSSSENSDSSSSYHSDSSSDSSSSDGNILDRYSLRIIFNSYKLFVLDRDQDELIHSLVFMLTQFPEALIAKTQTQFNDNPSLIHDFLERAPIQFKDENEETSFIIFKACVISYQKLILLNDSDNIAAFTDFVNQQLSVEDL